MSLNELSKNISIEFLKNPLFLTLFIFGILYIVFKAIKKDDK